MTLLTVDRATLAGHPLDIAEQLAIARDWHSRRPGPDELEAEIAGSWCNFRLLLGWDDRGRALCLSCFFAMRIPRERRSPVYELLARVNEATFMGHFGLTRREGVPCYRHTLLLRGQRGASAEQVEDVVDIAVTEVERFYPVFQNVLWGGCEPDAAIAGSLLETVGEA